MRVRALDAGCRVALAVSLASVVGAGCGQETETHSCTLAGCGGLSTLTFAAPDDSSMAPSGQIRHSNPSWGTKDFDCRNSETKSASLSCSDGMLRFSMLERGDALEIRFEMQDGSMSEWQPIPLSVITNTLEDFNGPGCPCTYYTASAPPIAVPTGALLTAPGASDGGT